MTRPLPLLPVLTAIGGLLMVSVVLQRVREPLEPAADPALEYLYVPSGHLVEKAVLSFDALAADVYWIRAIQHYGGTKRSAAPDKKYALLYPLLDVATTLDPYFNIAYRFGAIFLAEPYPAGPGRPDLAIQLLEKGIRNNPERWQYRYDIGFVHYWWRRDYDTAASWFRQASEIDGAPWWLETLAATTLAEGGERAASRMLWTELSERGDNDWLRAEASRRLQQIEALDAIDRLHALAAAYAQRTGRAPTTWTDLIQAGDLPAVPRDPAGHQYVIDLARGVVAVSPDSPLSPLPAPRRVR